MENDDVKEEPVEMADEYMTDYDVTSPPIKHECYDDVKSEVCENEENVSSHDCRSDKSLTKTNFDQSAQRHIYPEGFDKLQYYLGEVKVILNDLTYTHPLQLKRAMSKYNETTNGPIVCGGMEANVPKMRTDFIGDTRASLIVSVDSDVSQSDKTLKMSDEKASRIYEIDNERTPKGVESPHSFDLNKQRCTTGDEQADDFTSSVNHNVSEYESDVTVTYEVTQLVNQKPVKKPDENRAPSNKRGKNLRSSAKTKQSSGVDGVKETKKQEKKSEKLRCSICRYTGPNNKCLKSHLARRHSAERPFACDKCPHISLTSYELKQHLQLEHVGVKDEEDVGVKDEDHIFKCSVCPYQSVRRYRLQRHMMCRLHGMTISDRPYKCTKCTYTCTTRRCLEDHISSVHRGVRHQCPQCLFKAKTQVNLKRHIKNSHTMSINCFLCQDCGYACSRPYVLRNHISVVHTKDHICSVCGQKGSKGNIDRHMRTHSGERPFRCTECNASFKAPRTLSFHFACKHSTETPFSCKLCNYKGKTKKHMSEHMKKKHPLRAREIFACDICSFSTTIKHRVKTHVMSKHTGEHPYKCGDCDYTCIQKQSLNNHIMSQHTKQRPFKCSQCKYTTTTALQLKQHALGQHSSERNFTCSQCDFKTYTVGFLNQHMKKKHG